MTYTDRIHLVADSLVELHAFAEKIGLKRCYFENKRNKNHPHYDLVVNKKGDSVYINGEKAIDIVLSLGTELISTREIVKLAQAQALRTTPLQQSLKFIAISNEMFKGSKPMNGKEYSILQEALKKSANAKPTLKGRL